MHIGTQELILILLIAAVVFGGARLAGIGKALGKSVREFRDEVKSKPTDQTSDENKEESGE
jgi:sec-independent protein translocase protein TatA